MCTRAWDDPDGMCTEEEELLHCPAFFQVSYDGLGMI